MELFSIRIQRTFQLVSTSLDTVGGSGINHRNAEMLSDHGLGQH